VEDMNFKNSIDLIARELNDLAEDQQYIELLVITLYKEIFIKQQE
jgi:hypothetical protein